MANSTRRPPKSKARPFPLRRLLRRFGITSYWLAKKSGISSAMLCRIANGKTNPTWSTVIRIVRALGCSVGDLEFRRRPA